MVSHSNVTEDYLKALYAAQERGESGVGVTELARRMGVVASTASETVRKLHRQGLVDHAPYQKVHLSVRGRELATTIIRRHRILETYLYERLDFEWDEVHREAEILEHAVSDALLDKMDKVLGYPDRDPHGDPIPKSDGTESVVNQVPLLSVALGETFLVSRISDDEPSLLRLLESRGIILDAHVQLIQKLDYAGMVTISVTPPAHWQPRNAAVLSSGVMAGATKQFDLSEVAAAAIYVAP